MFGTKLNSSDNKNNEVTREIKQKCGILSTNNRGWSKAVNVISWNGGEDKLDIRDWNEDMWCYVKITDTLNLCFLVKSAKCTNWSHLFHGLLDNEPLMA